MDQPMQPSMNMPMGMMGTMTDPQRYQAMLQMRQGQQPNGQIDHNALKRAAAMNRNP